MTKPPYQLPLIPHKIEGKIIRQRSRDGYINATAMCKAAGREWRRYRRLDSTREYIAALEAATGIRSSELIQTLTGGDPRLQGTWVHPQVAINLAQWLSPEFAVQVSKWVFEWLSDGAPPERLPVFVQRFHLNSERVSSGHFSVINELFIRLYGRLEQAGYVLPDKAEDGREIRPDVSVGKLFSTWLRDNHTEYDGRHSYYRHGFIDGFECDARQYPNIVWPHFMEFMDEVWIPQHAERYLKGRDPKALEFLPRLLPGPNRKDRAA